MQIVSGLALSSRSAKRVNQLVNAKARRTGVTPSTYVAGLLTGEYPPLKLRDVLEISEPGGE
jgi:hypothetical protein